jgi:hypothetical protein
LSEQSPNSEINRLKEPELKSNSSRQRIFALVFNFLAVISLLLVAVVPSYSQSSAEKNELAALYQKASDGDANSQLELGLRYLLGCGVAIEDSIQAREWFVKSADQGNATARFWLGEMYSICWGILEDKARAVMWYRKAADHVLATARYDLGNMYDTGMGVPLNHKEAVTGIRKAANREFAPAKLWLQTHSSSGLFTAPAQVPSPSVVTVTATSQSDPAQSGSADTTIVSTTVGSTYYLAPAAGGGNDSNDGLSPSRPWLSPKHAVNCGDVLLAAPGNYDSANFWNSKWGHVNCPAKNDVAWVKCATFDTCKISSSSQAAMFVSASYWGVQGWEVTTTGGGNTCINIAPDYFNTSQIDHIIVANNVVNRCDGDGINSGNGYGTQVGTDYVAYLGNIAYDTGHNFCAAGMSFWAPVASDTAAGTHYYMSGNFAWNNHSTCGDAEGIILDTLDGVEAGNTPKPYDQQVVATNNMVMWNDGPGMQVDLNMNGSPNVHSHVYMTHNTLVNNGVGASNATYCAQLVEGTTVNTEAFGNLSATYQPYCFGGSSVVSYAEAAVFAPSSTNKIHDDYAYSSFGNSIGNIGSSGFTPGPNNITSPDPAFVNPIRPGAPGCSGKASVPDCMATVIANFTPTNNAAKTYGYQIPTGTPVADPLFPQWMCGVTHLPAGLVTMGCK